MRTTLPLKSIALLAVGLTVVTAAFAVTKKETALRVGSKAPAFETRTVEGKRLTLASLRGKVVLLDFWATWCGPCRMSTPTIVRLYNRFSKDGLRVVGMSLDDADSRDQIAPFRQAFSVPYTLTYSPKENQNTAMTYHVNVDSNSGDIYDHPIPPTFFVIDRSGRVRWLQTGYSPDDETKLTMLIKKLVAKKS